MTTTTDTPTPRPATTQRYFYAAEWPFGVTTNANTGRPWRYVRRFATREARDEWVDRCAGYRTQANYRQTVSRSEVEAEIRRAERRAVEWNLDACRAWAEDGEGHSSLLP